MILSEHERTIDKTLTIRDKHIDEDTLSSSQKMQVEMCTSSLYYVYSNFYVSIDDWLHDYSNAGNCRVELNTIIQISKETTLQN